MPVGVTQATYDNISQQVASMESQIQTYRDTITYIEGQLADYQAILDDIEVSSIIGPQ